MDKNKEILKKLSAPFTMIGVDNKNHAGHKWKVKVTKGDFAICVPYIDARQVTQRLNEVLGIDGWSDVLIETAGAALICELTIIIDGKEITRSNVGMPSEYAKEKGKASDALKRAASKYGVGEYLYGMQSVKLSKINVGGKIYAATSDGKALMTGEELSSYINLKHPLRAKFVEIYESLNEKEKKEHGNKFVDIWNILSEK